MKIIYIAEIGNNHNGDINLAKRMIDAAIASEADYVKFQLYNIDKFIAKSNPHYSEFAKDGLSLIVLENCKVIRKKKVAVSLLHRLMKTVWLC